MALNLKTDDWISNKNIITQEIPKIYQGMLVKIANNFERFWVKVTEVNDKYLIGSIDNYLTFNENYDYKDKTYNLNDICLIYSLYLKKPLSQE